MKPEKYEQFILEATDEYLDGLTAEQVLEFAKNFARVALRLHPKGLSALMNAFGPAGIIRRQGRTALE